MNATICPRCGGMAQRCECAELRREGMAMALAAVRDARRRQSYGSRSVGWDRAELAIKELACPPEPLT